MANFFLRCVVPALLMSAQQPTIQNGPVETRQVTRLGRDIAAIAAPADEPVWVGWRVVAAAGIVSECGAVLEGSTGRVPPITIGGVFVLVRLAGHAPDRVRAVADNCPIDAGGRQVYWLEGVTAADSVKYLQGLVALSDQPQVPADTRRRLNSGAIFAIGQHRDDSIDALIALATQAQDTAARSTAFNALSRSKDPKAMAFIDGILRR